MEKDDWYEDRIIWRANQHKLFDKKCCKFSDLRKDDMSVIKEKIIEEINPVIVFWESRDTWTALGTRAVCSFYNGKLSFSWLDSINKQVSLYHPDELSSEDVKDKSNFILLDKTGVIIWAPASSELYALMNILLMFPLKNKNIA